MGGFYQQLYILAVLSLRMTKQGEQHDLSFLATIYQSIGRPEDFITNLKEEAKQNPKFDRNNRVYLGLFYKSVIDSYRNTLRTIDQYKDPEGDGQSEQCYEAVCQKWNTYFNSLEQRCNEALDLIDRTLLPNAESSEAKVFYQKLKGDLFRYITEFATEKKRAEASEKADEAYRIGQEIASKDLGAADPVRLGNTLNYAVFKYEHQKKIEDAIEMLKDSIAKATPEIGQLSENSKKESINVTKVMESNLKNWCASDDGEEEESPSNA